MSVDLLLEHFDSLVDSPNGVERTRKFVLSLAFAGRLAEAGDPPPPLAADGDVALPWRVPDHWRVVALGDVVPHRLGKMLDKAKNRGRPVPYLGNINVRWFGFDLRELKEIRVEQDEIAELALHAGDVLVCEGGEPGRAAVWSGERQDVVFQKAVHRLRPPEFVDSRFLAYLFRHLTWSDKLAPYMTGATIKHLTGQALTRLPLPLPSVDEQRRIVAKVGELMALLDDYEWALEGERRACEQLAGAAMAQVLGE